MAQDARTVFKRCFTQTCAAVHVPFGRFATAVGFNNFLLDSFDAQKNSHEVAALALDQLCAGDKRLNDQIVCLAVIAFLDEMLGKPEVDRDYRRRLADLAELTAQRATADQYETWVETWYE